MYTDFLFTSLLQQQRQTTPAPATSPINCSFWYKWYNKFIIFFEYLLPLLVMLLHHKMGSSFVIAISYPLSNLHTFSVRLSTPYSTGFFSLGLITFQVNNNMGISWVSVVVVSK
jgi:hypothetical protein